LGVFYRRKGRFGKEERDNLPTFRTLPARVNLACTFMDLKMITIWGAPLLTTVLFSFSALFGNRTLKTLDGTEANFWRLSMAMMFLGAYSYAFGIGMSGVAFPTFLLSGFVGFGIGDLAYFQALPKLGSRLTIMLIHCLAAPMASAVEWAWMGTVLGWKEALCSATILAGVSIALAPGKGLQLTKAQLYSGIGYGLIAAFGQGMGAVLSRKAFALAQAAGQPIDGINAAFQRIIGGVVISAVVLLYLRRNYVRAGHQNKTREQHASESKGKWKTVAPWLILNALAGPTLGVSCYQWALRESPTGIVLPIVAMTPLVIIPLAMWFENERPEKRSVIGGVVAVMGVVALAILKSR
jgi:drug/metabolite transporter (DMT)-like permease